MMDRLAMPFEIRDVKFLPKNVRGNRALAMPYISARNVMDRLDEVFEICGWQDNYDVLNDGSVVCRLAVMIGEVWVTKTDVGSPSEQPDAGDRLKAAFSDGLKRAAVKLGVGRYLYSIPPIWADYDPQKKMFVGVPALPHWALPKAKGQAKPAQVSQPVQQPAVVEKPGGGGQAANQSAHGKTLPERQQDVYEEFLSSLNKAESESEVLGIGGLIKAKMVSDEWAMTDVHLSKLRDQMKESLEFFRNQGTEAGGDADGDAQSGPY